MWYLLIRESGCSLWACKLLTESIFDIKHYLSIADLSELAWLFIGEAHVTVTPCSMPVKLLVPWEFKCLHTRDEEKIIKKRLHHWSKRCWRIIKPTSISIIYKCDMFKGWKHGRRYTERGSPAATPHSWLPPWLDNSDTWEPECNTLNRISFFFRNSINYSR